MRYKYLTHVYPVLARLGTSCLYQNMWFSYLSHMRAAKDQASMHIRTVSLEPSLIALKRRDVDKGSGQVVYTSSCGLVTYRICEQPKTRRICTCAKYRQIMFEFLSAFEKSEEKTCLDDFGFFTCTKVNRKSVIRHTLHVKVKIDGST